jgi:hypothetical protein
MLGGGIQKVLKDMINNVLKDKNWKISGQVPNTNKEAGTHHV